MESDEIYKFIGYAVAVLFFLFVITKVLKLQTRIIEGARNRTNKEKNKENNKEKKKKKKANGEDEEDEEDEEDDKKKVKTYDQDVLIDKIDDAQKVEYKLANYLDITDSDNKQNYKDFITSKYNSLNYQMLQQYFDGTGGDNKAYNDLKTSMDTLEFLYNSIDRLATDNPTIDSGSGMGGGGGGKSGSKKSGMF